ncbi:MAG: hypothetical protein M3O25_00140, partial [Actinomycetota bacterium]|nr:hypothetical protein [Actinomycetota bacterium]
MTPPEAGATTPRGGRRPEPERNRRHGDAGANKVPPHPLNERQRRLRQRAVPIAIAAVVAFTVGAISAAGSAEEDAANRFVEAWADQNFATMHAQLAGESQQQFPVEQLAAAYKQAQSASTATAIDPGEASGPDDGVITVDVGVRTELFGLIDGTLKLPFRDEKIVWDPHLTFPNLLQGER